MSSIRSALSRPLLAGGLIVLTLSGIASSIAVEKMLRREFDRTLLAKARLLATLTEHDLGRIVIHFADEYMPEFSTAPPREYFQLWTGNGRVVERSRSLGRDRLPRPASGEPSPQFTDLVLPDGRPGRLVRISFIAQPKEGEEDSESELADRTGPRALLSVARGTEDLRRLLLAKYAIEGATLAVIGLGLALVIRRGIARGLAPLGALARQVEALRPERLATRVAIDPQVAELEPVVTRLNDLLSRLERAFERERQFSANVAHELRTPIAELKSLAEVGALCPDDPSATGLFFTDTLAIARQMEGITEQLLALARTEAGLEIADSDRVDLSELVEACWAPLAATAVRRNLDLDRKFDASLVIVTDRAKLGRILANLLSNAVEYSPEGSRIELRATNDPTGTAHLEVSNRAPQLTQEDLPSMFTRFWRKDPARAGGDHSGLGLALARSLAELLGFALSAQLSAEGRLTVRLSGRLGSPSDMARFGHSTSPL